jgi:LPXTG-motif cell wall-anchored protein
VLGAGSIFATSAGIFAAGTSGNQTVASHIFKISISGMADGADSGSGSGSTPDSGSSTGSSGNTSSSTPAPTLVTSANAAALVRAPGSESIIVNGQEVVIESNNVNIPAARTPAAQRTAAQVKSIQQAGAALLQQFLASLPAGATSNVTVVNTATGAVMQNLVFDANGNSVNVPVEDIVFLDGPQLSLMIGSNNANITADGKYQVGAGAIVGVTGSGLGVSANGEIIAMSTPTLLANFQTTAAGDFTKSATLPSSIGVGDHTLVVAAGSTYAMMGIRVVPAALPTTGTSTENVVIIALFTLVFGALFFRGRRSSLI